MVIADPNDEGTERDALFLQHQRYFARIAVTRLHPVGEQDDDVPAGRTGREVIGRLLQ